MRVFAGAIYLLALAVWYGVVDQVASNRLTGSYKTS
jgi:hypothetical protein